MLNNPQNTLGLRALKFYGKMRSIRLEALSWLKIVVKESTSRTIIIPSYHKSQLMHYIIIDIIHPTITILLSPKPQFKHTTHSNMLIDLKNRKDSKNTQQQGRKKKG